MVKKFLDMGGVNSLWQKMVKRISDMIAIAKGEILGVMTQHVYTTITGLTIGDDWLLSYASIAFPEFETLMEQGVIPENKTTQLTFTITSLKASGIGKVIRLSNDTYIVQDMQILYDGVIDAQVDKYLINTQLAGLSFRKSGTSQWGATLRPGYQIVASLGDVLKIAQDADLTIAGLGENMLSSLPYGIYHMVVIDRGRTLYGTCKLTVAHSPAAGGFYGYGFAKYCTLTELEMPGMWDGTSFGSIDEYRVMSIIAEDRFYVYNGKDTWTPYQKSKQQIGIPTRGLYEYLYKENGETASIAERASIRFEDGDIILRVNYSGQYVDVPVSQVVGMLG